MELGQQQEETRVEIMQDAPSEKEDSKKIIPLSELPKYIQYVTSQDPQQWIEGASALRDVLKQNEEDNKVPIQAILDGGVVPRLVQFLSYSNQPKLQYLGTTQSNSMFWFIGVCRYLDYWENL